MKVVKVPMGVTMVATRERVLIRVDSSVARCIAAVMVLCTLGVLIALAAGGDRSHWHGGRLAWSVTLLALTAFIARGIFLGRPVTMAHAAAAAIMVTAGVAVHVFWSGVLGDILVASAGLILMCPTTARPQPGELARIWPLVDATSGDPLAPFAMQASKTHYFNAAGTAAIAYRTRLGFAVVGGDPIGDEAGFAELVRGFTDMCHHRGWRIMVLGCSEQRLGLWRDARFGHAMLQLPIGRDVVIDVQHFALTGRKFRNLRQGVQRTHNAGITTAVVDEQDIDDALTAELAEVLYCSHKGAHTERGFIMNLDAALERRYAGIKLIIARDRYGRVQGFHRYATAGHGCDVTLDLPWRRPDAPNGIDERLSVDMLTESKCAGAQRLSLSFAPFPDLFTNTNGGFMSGVFRRLIHLLNPLVRLESLYRSVRKYHSMGAERYALLCVQHIPAAVPVLLSLEFMPRRRRLPAPHR